MVQKPFVNQFQQWYTIQFHNDAGELLEFEGLTAPLPTEGSTEPSNATAPRQHNSVRPNNATLIMFHLILCPVI